jgi:hypothetical protein
MQYCFSFLRLYYHMFMVTVSLLPNAQKYREKNAALRGMTKCACRTVTHTVRMFYMFSLI